jgi:hypothetical protein
MALVAGLIIPIYFNRKMKIPAKESLAQVWFPAALSTLPSILLIVIWQSLIPPSSWLALFAVVAATGAVTVVSAWFLGMSTPERQRLLAVVRGVH